ncbi:hypothetical protein AVEN_96419-1, partial [Araneus ventricosus]
EKDITTHLFPAIQFCQELAYKVNDSSAVSPQSERLYPKTRPPSTDIGSLTTPPCDEGVIWSTEKTPISV